MQQGQITIFLSLILSLLLSLICTAAEAARVEGIMLQGKTAVQMAESSLLSRYQPELLDQYDVFFIDGTFGKNNFSTDRIENWVSDVFSYNLHTRKNLSLGNEMSFFNCGVSYLELDNFCLATDAQGYEFYKQAIAYEKNKLGIELLEQLVGQAEQGEEFQAEGERLKQEEAAQKETMNRLEEENRETEHAFSQEDFKDGNPLGGVEASKATGILSLIMGSKTISGKTVNQELLASGRELLVGSGEEEEDTFFGSLEDQVLFGEYVMEKFHHALSEDKGVGLSYELEYILIGKDSDKENLQGVLDQLLLLREGMNYLYLHTDSQKMAEADALAISLVGFTGLAPLVVAMRELLLLGWAYAESVMDLQSLMDGGTLALWKTSENWKMGLSGIGNLSGGEGAKREEKGGLSYEGYLRLLLDLQGGKQKVMRVLDLIETNIRQIKGKENFRMDCCFNQCTYRLSIGADAMFLKFPQLNNMLNNSAGHYDFSLEGSWRY